MDITKYLKNKDLQIKQEDFDIAGIEKEIREGYVEKSKIPDISNMISKDEYTKLQTSYSELETNYNNTIKKLDDTNTKNSQLNLQNKMISKGFKENDFDEVSKLRTSLYADEKDDKKAIDMIAERFKSTYFANEGQTKTTEPNDTAFNNSNNQKTKDIKITRNTSIKDLIISK